MRKTLAAAMAALTVGGTVAAVAAPTAADAQGWRGEHYYGHRYYGHRDGDAVGAALLGGLAGLAIGASINSHPHYYSYGYGPAYYDDYYARPAVCESSRWVWDPYIGRHVLVRHRYPC